MNHVVLFFHKWPSGKIDFYVLNKLQWSLLGTRVNCLTLIQAQIKVNEGGDHPGWLLGKQL